jgi:hypothetical protein
MQAPDDKVVELQPPAAANEEEVELAHPLSFATVPREVELSWKDGDEPLSVAITINDRYFGFFEPFSHAFDVVITGSTPFYGSKASSVTCFMSTNILRADTPVKALTLYQTEQLSRAGELARVVREIETWCNRGVFFTVWDYSQFNMKVLQEATRPRGLQFHHEYKPLVTPPK